MNDAAAAHVLEALSPHRGKFLAFVRGRVGDDAEDVLQLAMMRAALKAEALHDPAKVTPWFYRILRNAIADHRSRAGQPRLGALEEDTPEAATETPAEVCGCSMTLLDSIRPEYAEMLRRVDVEEEPIAEAAAALGITANNATVRLHRARKSLREALLGFCGTQSMRACLSCSCDV